MYLTISHSQYKIYKNESVPLSSACFKPNALSSLKSQKKKHLFQEIKPMKKSEFDRWSSETLQVVEIIANIYEKMFNLNFNKKGMDLVFSNWISYLIFHFKSMHFEYSFIKKKYNSLEVAPPINKYIKIPLTIKELRVFLQNDHFNEIMFFYFVSENNFSFYDLSKIVKENHHIKKKSFKNFLKSLLKRFHLIYSTFFSNIYPDNFVTSKLKDNYELMPDLDDFNFHYSKIDLDLRQKFYSILKKKLKDIKNLEYNKISLLLSYFIPISMFEDILKIKKLSTSFNFRKNSIFYSKTAHYNNELFKIKLAEELKSNKLKLAIICHGGGYHHPMWFDRDWERRFADYLIPHKKTNYKKYVSKFTKFKFTKSSNLFDEVLIVGTTFEIYRSGWFPVPDQWQMCQKYADSIINLITGLNSIYKSIYFRPHFNDYGWGLTEYLLSHHHNLKIIYPKEESLESNIKRFKTIINTADTTAMIKCFQNTNFNIGLIDPLYFDDNMNEIINRLYDCNIYFKNPNDLIKFLKNLSVNSLSNDELLNRKIAISDYLQFMSDCQTKN